MKTQFEKLKDNFLHSITMNYSLGGINETVNMHILFEQAMQPKLLKAFHGRKVEFKEELKKWLDTYDIRMVGSLIDVMKKGGVKMPSWVKNKKFIIDYNKKMQLDILRMR